MALAPGTRLGPYEIVAPLGAGGMGDVYRARDTRLERLVAIKVLSERLWEDEGARQRIEREARAVSGLNHPHICALYDIGELDGRCYLVLEHLEGRTLADRLEEGALPLEQALGIAREIGDALLQAHRQGVVHRDLKPGNVMLTRTGAKLLDFGLARSAGSGPGDSDLTALPTVTSPLTTGGAVPGTLQYMAPEQLERNQTDARSDIFAFGVVLYEMVSGRRAFPGTSQASVIAAILKEQPPSLGELGPVAPPALDRLVNICLAKDPDERRQTMRDVLIDLEWIGEADSKGGTVQAVQTRRGPGLTWALAAAAILLAAALALALTSRAQAPPPAIRARITLPEKTYLDLDMVNPGPAVLSPDGLRMVFSAREEGGPVRLWIRDMDGLQARPISGTEDGGYPFWSPDGRSIGFFAQGKLSRLDLQVGRPVKLCDAPTGKGGTWNRDGTILFAPAFNSGIHRVSQDGGDSTPVTTLEEGQGTHRFPFFLPDGRHFLYLSEGAQRSSVWVGSLGGGGRFLLEADSHAVFASGHLLYLVGNSLVAQPFDPGRLEMSGEPFLVAEGVADLPGTHRGDFSVSDKGVMIYRPSMEERAVDLLWVDRKGEPLRSLSKLASPFDSVALAPGDGRVALSVQGASGEDVDIWIYDSESGQRSRFTFGVNGGNPVWSPDGESLAFLATVEGKTGLYRKLLRGSEITSLKTEMAIPTSWSADGRLLAVLGAGEGTGADIWFLPMTEDRERYPYLQTRNLEVNPQFSPDGGWIAYAANDTGRFEVYVGSIEEPDRRWQISTNGGQSPMWRGDGKELYFVGPGRALVAATLRIEGSIVSVTAAEDLFTLPGYSQSLWQGFGVVSDGTRFLVQRLASGEDPSTSAFVLVTDWRAGLTG